MDDELESSAKRDERLSIRELRSRLLSNFPTLKGTGQSPEDTSSKLDHQVEESEFFEPCEPEQEDQYPETDDNAEEAQHAEPYIKRTIGDRFSARKLGHLLSSMLPNLWRFKQRTEDKNLELDDQAELDAEHILCELDQQLEEIESVDTNIETTENDSSANGEPNLENENFEIYNQTEEATSLESEGSDIEAAAQDDHHNLSDQQTLPEQSNHLSVRELRNHLQSNLSKSGEEDQETKNENLEFHEEPEEVQFSDADIETEKDDHAGWFIGLSHPLKNVRHVLADCLELPRSVIFSSFFINLLGLSLPLAILQVYDRILPNSSLETLSLLLIGLIVIFLLEGAMKIARAYVMAWAAAQNSYYAELEAVSRILKSDITEIEKNPPSIWMDRLDALGELNRFHGGSAKLILIDFPFVAIFLSVILFVGGTLVLVPIAVVVGLGIMIMRRGKKLQDLLQARAEQDGKRYDFITECLAGILTIKSMAMEPQIQRRYERLQQFSAEVSYRTILHGASMQSIGNFFANLTMILVVFVGAFAVMNGTLSIGALACCSLLSGRMIQPVIRGIGVWTEMHNVAIANERASELFELPSSVDDVIDDQAIEPVECHGGITVRNLCFRHGENQYSSIEDVTFSIAPGEIFAIRGSDGSGKSTLARIIMGEFIPERGSVYIDGHNVTAMPSHSLRNSICYVPDNATPFRGTILENITMFRSGTTIEQARRAAQLIGMEEDINRLPEGYDTFIGDGITDILPVGLIQRIAIARAVAQNSKILILDEANASLDHDSDRLFREGLLRLKGRVTIFIVSNRPSLLEIADHVYSLDKEHSDDDLLNEAHDVGGETSA